MDKKEIKQDSDMSESTSILERCPIHIYTITEFTTEAFIEFQERINSIPKDVRLRIYLDSNGWSVMTKDMYKDVIEFLTFPVEIVGMTMFSSAFTLFREVKCPKRILPSSYAMVHMEAWEVQVWENWIPRGDLQKFKMQDQYNSNFWDISFLTGAEKELYKEGRDVFLSNYRLQEIFKSS